MSFGLLCVNYSLGIDSQGTGAKMQNILAAAVAVGEKLPVISDPGVLCLLPALSETGRLLCEPAVE